MIWVHLYQSALAKPIGAFLFLRYCLIKLAARDDAITVFVQVLEQTTLESML